MHDIVVHNIDPEFAKKVIEGITSGMNYPQLKDWLIKKGYEEQLDSLGPAMIEAHGYLTKRANIDHNYETGLALERLNNLYMNCFKIQDFKACFQIQKEIIALSKQSAGDSQPQRNDNNHPSPDVNLDLTDLNNVSK